MMPGKSPNRRNRSGTKHLECSRSVGCLVFLHNLGANPSSLRDIQTVLVRPDPDSRAVDPRASRPSRAGPSAAADSPTGLDIRLEGFLELGSVLLSQVDFIADAVEIEADGFGTIRAIQIVTDNYLYVSRHARNNADGSSSCQIGT
jgi:predicted esterase